MRKIVSLFVLTVTPLLALANPEVQVLDRYEYAEVLRVQQAIERQQVEVRQTVCQQRPQMTGSVENQAFDTLEQQLRTYAGLEATPMVQGRSRQARVCHTETEQVWRDVLVGYDVRVLYKGNMYDVRTATDPGERLKLKILLVPDE